MQLISRVEINYFRSIYSISLTNAQDMGILIGGNDSGKSNILKALNLFFNNQTELDNDLDFLEDLNKFRGREVREVKGRATIWVKITFRNVFGWRSLPREFTIKRTWNRYEDFPLQDVFPSTIPNATIGKFLKKIDFHYIPAVRSREIFSRYLGLLHDSLIEDEGAGLRDASEALVARINDDISEMSEEINRKLGFSSRIDIPEDFRNLFEALDFSTSYSGQNIALQRRGDGIQARHIPFILNFLSQRSKKTHIWAYEEPENSLEFSNAFKLSHQFQNEFTDQSQIFVTTHSPAFYDAKDCPVSRWLVRNEPFENRYETQVSDVDEKHLPDTELGLSVLLRDRARELYEQINDLKESNDSLSEYVRHANMPVLLVEGKTDRQLFEEAKDRFSDELNSDIQIIEAGNAGKVAQFVKLSTEAPMKNSYKVFGLVDNDWEGRKVCKDFQNYPFAHKTRFKQISKKQGVFCGDIGVPHEYSDVASVFKKYGKGSDGLWLTIEYLFPSSMIEDAYEKGILAFDDVEYRQTLGDLNVPVNVGQIVHDDLPNQFWYSSKKVRDSCKKRFVEFAKAREKEDFRNLADILFEIDRVIGA